MNHFIREPINSLTHLAGLLLSVAGMILLLVRALEEPTAAGLTGALVFSLGLIGLYSASTIYHWAKASPRVIARLRTLDHIMIYILIAATYTPICLLALNQLTGGVLLGVIWTLTLTGIILKLVWTSAPRWLYTGLYLGLGWAAITVIYPLIQALPAMAIVLMVSGGLSYTVGAVIYGLKPRRLRVGPFGFHEIFHLFILAGSLLHFLMVYLYVL